MEEYERDEETRRMDIKITVDVEPYKETRGLLFRKNLSLQEFMNHLMCLSARGDDRVLMMMEELRRLKSDSPTPTGTGRRTNTSDLFNMLERASALKSVL